MYSKAAGTGTNVSVLAWVQGTKGFELFECTATNDTATELTTVINAQSLGDNMFNSTVQRIWLQAQDGASVDKVEFIDEMGGVVMTIQGGERGATASSQSNQYNLYAKGLSVLWAKVGRSKSPVTTTSEADCHGCWLSNQLG